jgi:hypothetical protein
VGLTAPPDPDRALPAEPAKQIHLGMNGLNHGDT